MASAWTRRSRVPLLGKSLHAEVSVAVPGGQQESTIVAIAYGSPKRAS